MALQSSGAISLANIAAEFGDTQPHSLSEFYRGGGKVPNTTQNNNVPTSGAISLGNFYGAVNRVAINITISSNEANYVLTTAKASGYVAGISDITLTINSGIYVSSDTIGGPALNVDASWAAGDTITIVNNGFVVGMGGAGGNGGTGSTTSIAASAGSAGGAGRDALWVATNPGIDIRVHNNGTIAGGGGGGGGGRGFYSSSYSNTRGGGGGGGGRSSAARNSLAGVGGGGAIPGANGQPGTTTAAGVGGGAPQTDPQGDGGGGGDWGSTGTAGNGNIQGAGTAGGSAGAAVVGNANITSWEVTGTRLGAIT